MTHEYHLDSPTFAYHLLRAALDSYQKNPSALGDDERAKVSRKARQTYQLEDRVMASPEAAGVVIDPGQLDRAVAEVRSRYESEQAFDQDLARNGLQQETLRDALHRELRFDAVLQKVGARHTDVNELDIALFYEMHRERFHLPEKRVARHILVTINDAYSENQRTVALARCRDIAGRVRHKTNRFASLARRHSECPTAMDGGKLGSVSRGQLYPELDAALFALEPDQVSDIIETELGFHILWCERIEPGKKVPLQRARPKVREILEQRKRRNCQKTWLNELKRADTAATEPEVA